MGWMSGWSGIFRLGNRRWVEDEMVHEMAAGMKKIKGSGVREELAVWGEWWAGGGLGAKIRGVTLCKAQWSYKPSCCNIVNAEVFLFEKWFDTFMQEKGVVGYRVQNQSLCVGVHRGECLGSARGICLPADPCLDSQQEAEMDNCVIPVWSGSFSYGMVLVLLLWTPTGWAGIYKVQTSSWLEAQNSNAVILNNSWLECCTIFVVVRKSSEQKARQSCLSHWCSDRQKDITTVKSFCQNVEHLFGNRLSILNKGEH